jgi:hypothetical protein
MRVYRLQGWPHVIGLVHSGRDSEQVFQVVLRECELAETGRRGRQEVPARALWTFLHYEIGGWDEQRNRRAWAGCVEWQLDGGEWFMYKFCVRVGSIVRGV